MSDSSTPLVIKRYQNRKFYDTKRSVYVVMDDMLALVQNHVVFTVVDQKTNVDITREVMSGLVSKYVNFTADEAYKLLTKGTL